MNNQTKALNLVKSYRQSGRVDHDLMITLLIASGLRRVQITENLDVMMRVLISRYDLLAHLYPADYIAKTWNDGNITNKEEIADSKKRIQDIISHIAIRNNLNQN
jgi:hypothetical protein